MTASRAYPPMLFDLDDDPLELCDLAEVRADVTSKLMEIVERSWPMDTLHQSVQRSQAARKFVDSALAQGRQEVWDYQPSTEQRYVRRGDEFPDIERGGYVAARRSPEDAAPDD